LQTIGADPNGIMRPRHACGRLDTPRTASRPSATHGIMRSASARYRSAPFRMTSLDGWRWLVLRNGIIPQRGVAGLGTALHWQTSRRASNVALRHACV
jgi:hypothetical protein